MSFLYMKKNTLYKMDLCIRDEWGTFVIAKTSTMYEVNQQKLGDLEFPTCVVVDKRANLYFVDIEMDAKGVAQ